ncbi:inhibitor of apoptosis protein-like [Mercenaria mercenaria]|uniref:inhibitor of apoptosis protein-like n=1 Tax=Mercenaria mercenaria TaxID=6596 RepID=UPI00234F2BC6|nr:inhibitor of apoptosis protein-like [Mercenaria mercenaria]
MNNEWNRYQSFKDFPESSSASPLQLAQAGFYYMGTREDATCFCCGLTIGLWTTDEIVPELHKRLSPNCRYLTGEDTTNVPIHGDAYSEQYVGAAIEVENISTSTSENIRYNPRQSVATTSGANGSYGDEGSICVSDVRANQLRLTLSQANSQIEYFPGITTQKPKHPDYAIKSVRLSSFTNWCPDVMDPEQLAEAGFYYTDVQDCVRCFFCGGGMKNWENGDNAWIEHARWFPDCAYVKQCKGDTFVSMCRMANIDYMTADGEMQNQGTEGLNLVGGKELIEDQLVQDLNSTASKLVMGMGYMQEEVENAIKLAREKYGSSELRAQYILESLLDNSYINNGNNIPVQNNQRDRDEPSAASGCSLDTAHVERKSSDIKEDQTNLLEENRQLKNQMICKICLDKNACVVFLPCGHMVSCVECAHALRKCAVCRSVIQGSVRAYPA